MAGRNRSLGRNKCCKVRVGVMEGFLYINNLGVGVGPRCSLYGQHLQFNRVINHDVQGLQHREAERERY